MGLVEISGLAAGPYVLTSAFKQVECYYYHSTAWQLKQQGKNTQWVKVAEETLHVPFYLDDDTGKVLVDPRGAEMDLHCDLSEQYHRSILFSGPEMPGSVVEFLTRYGVEPDRRIKVEERCIKPKNFLFVLGTLSQNPGLDASIRPAWAERAGQKFMPPFNAKDKNKDDEGECTAAAADAAPVQQIIRLSSETNSLPAVAMTQQQKIAAALVKAGISNPAAWSLAAKPQAAAALKPQSASGSGAKNGSGSKIGIRRSQRFRSPPSSRPDARQPPARLLHFLEKPARRGQLSRLEIEPHDLGRPRPHLGCRLFLACLFRLAVNCAPARRKKRNEHHHSAGPFVRHRRLLRLSDHAVQRPGRA